MHREAMMRSDRTRVAAASVQTRRDWAFTGRWMRVGSASGRRAGECANAHLNSPSVSASSPNDRRRPRGRVRRRSGRSREPRLRPPKRPGPHRHAPERRATGLGGVAGRVEPSTVPPGVAMDVTALVPPGLAWAIVAGPPGGRVEILILGGEVPLDFVGRSLISFEISPDGSVGAIFVGTRPDWSGEEPSAPDSGQLTLENPCRLAHLADRGPLGAVQP